MKKTLLLLAAATALAGITAPASAAGMDKVKACFVYVGPVGDFGWSYQHDQGRLYAEEKLGDKVETAYLESVPEGADSERAIERFARSGCNIIFTTSFGYMDPTNKIAKDFPDVKFEHATGYKREHPNVATYDSKFFQGRYVIGQIAAKMSEDRHRRLHRLVPDPGSRAGHQLVHAWRTVDQSGFQAQGRLGQHLV
jgi:basic membrane protein A